MMAVLLSFSFMSLGPVFRKREVFDNLPLVRATAIGLLAFQPALYAFIFVAGFFDQRYGNAMLGVTFALIAITHQLVTQSTTQATSPLKNLTA
jgi:hypothetical protein